tara:strand:- start:3667 stop:3870 length:204 start_codon:yes stop_codon:yes gene_type:complete
MGIVIVTIFSEYKSAFEADQACHAELWNEYENLENYGCDHDLETNQWILFEKGINHQSGSVLKRFYY